MTEDLKREAENLKIIQTILKYDSFFQNSNADVAMTRKNVWIFYEYDEEYQCYNSFYRFETAEELKGLIAGLIAEDLNILIETTAENIHHALREIDINEVSKSSCKECIPELLSNIEVLNREFQKSAGRFQAIFQSLSGVLAGLE